MGAFLDKFDVSAGESWNIPESESGQLDIKCRELKRILKNLDFFFCFKIILILK